MKLTLACLFVASAASADPRATPTAPAPPKVVTQAWLHEMDDARWPIDALVDPVRGVIVLDREIDSPDENYVGVQTARKICKRADLHALKRGLHGMYKTADVFSCQNKPSIRCSFALAYEYTTTTTLAFEKADDGTLRLVSVAFLDGGSQVQSFKDEQARWVSKQLTKLEAVRCDGS
ncbi:MAG TPA: hypothetical protein VLT45_25165 [Kofleriaceae bacterium]|nr:hypothetical protein [Kofleriaceae bacterium]